MMAKQKNPLSDGGSYNICSFLEQFLEIYLLPGLFPLCIFSSFSTQKKSLLALKTKHY